MMWRALRGFLPTGQTLYNRRIRNNATWPNNLNLVNFWEWFCYLVQDRAERVWEKVVIAVWAIWWARNRQTAVREVDIDRWKPPQNSWVKLNFDAALHSNLLDVGLAKAVACYQGLLFAKETSFANVEVEGDARVVIEKIIQGEDGRADLLDRRHSGSGKRAGGCGGDEQRAVTD